MTQRLKEFMDKKYACMYMYVSHIHVCTVMLPKSIQLQHPPYEKGLIWSENSRITYLRTSLVDMKTGIGAKQDS